MAPGLLDHLFVAGVMGIVFPFVGWWAYRRFLARYEREGECALIREYRITILWLIALGAATVLTWLAGGRPIDGLGFVAFRQTGENGLALGIAIGLLGGLAIRPFAAGLSLRLREGMRRQFGRLTPFLPKTGGQLAWGIALSLAAGVFEEIAYRGYLIPYAQHWLPGWAGVAAAALLFGLAHLYQGKAGMVMTTMLGAVFGYLFVATGSLLLPIIVHVAVDVSAMVTAWLVLKPRSAAS
jgi:membrane protease YdiL (CAAX protease family)